MASGAPVVEAVAAGADHAAGAAVHRGDALTDTEDAVRGVVALTDATYDEAVKTGTWMLDFFAPCVRFADAGHGMRGSERVLA